MKRLSLMTAALVACLAATTPCLAAKARPAPLCCRIPAGAVVQVELAEEVGTRTQKAGDAFALRLAAPLIVDGRVVLQAGTPGVGRVVQASRPGMGGKAAKLVLAAEYLVHGRTRMRLQSLQLSAVGKGNVGVAQAIGLSGIVLGPIGFVGMAVRGGDVFFPVETKAQAKLSQATVLPSLRRATAPDLALAAPAETADVGAGAIEIPPPPPGLGQVVFFRVHSLLGTGQWFNVREDGQALGKLTNGAYFIQIAPPGVHTYTATSEPVFKDSLKLQVDPGETYFVEGILTKGLVIGAADLTPSDRGAFDKASKDLTSGTTP